MKSNAAVNTAFCVPIVSLGCSVWAHAGPPRQMAMELMLRSPEAQASIVPAEEFIAALPYDAATSFGARCQDFESEFDQYDIFVIEDIDIGTDARLDRFASAGFGSVNPFRTEDVGVRIFSNDGSGLPGEGGYTGELVLESVPGVGSFDGFVYKTEFGGQCLPAGAYYVVWAARLESRFGASACFVQAGDSTVGGGEANNAWWWNPGEGIFGVTHFPVIDPDTDLPIGVNYLLFGEPSNCGDGCSNPDCPADLDLDGDADSDDFFLYLDRFAGSDPCADIDGDTDSDSDDFFAYLDLFSQGC